MSRSLPCRLAAYVLLADGSKLFVLRSVSRSIRPWYFSALIFCWFATLSTGFDFSREYLLWLIGRLGIVGIWFGAISFFLLYANTFREKRRLERLMNEAHGELAALGLKYVKKSGQTEGSLRNIRADAPFDPYDDDNYE